MGSVAGLIVRDCDRATDENAIHGLDTSFSSDKSYEVERKGNSLKLFLQTLPEPRHKHFAIDPAEPVWNQGWVAEIDQQIRGFIATQFEPWNRRLIIWHFYVDARFRCRGIGTRLMRHALQAGRTFGARTAWAETSNVNHPGVEAYRRMGFRICGFDLTLYTGTPDAGEFALYLGSPISN